MKQLRILYASNAPWCASGYGVQSKSLLPRMKELDSVEDIAIFAWFGLQGGGTVANGFPVYPCGIDPYGNDMYGAHAAHFHADLIITLIDAWVIKPQAVKEMAPAKWMPWLPIDHDPAPRMVLDSLKGADYPVTYAKFGQRALREAGIENYYIPHGIEPKVFRVLPEEAVADFRKTICEDVDWLGVMVAANKGWPSRKGFEESLQAFKAALPVLPKRSMLYIHADYTKVFGGGDLLSLVKAYDLEDYVRFPNRYKMFIGDYSEAYLAMMYNAADVLLSPSKGEGFGIPIIEAQACGAPVVVTNFSSMPELVRWGIAVEPQSLQWTYQDSFQAIPNVPEITEAILKLDEERHSLTPSQLMDKRQATSSAIHFEYSWDSLVETYWAPLLKQVQTDLYGGQ